MSNIRNGGMMIIGINENCGKLDRTGMTMTTEHVNSFDYDKISAFVASYADPHVRFFLRRVTLESKIFIVISINEFDRVTVLCKKNFEINGKTQLRLGKLYTRTWRMPETVEVSTSDDLREIVELATEKGVAKFAELVSKSGLTSIMSTSITAEHAKPFYTQINALLSEESELLNNLKLKGYWKVIFRPDEFKRERVGLQVSKAHLERSIVTFRTYNYPHYYGDAYGKPVLGSDYVQWSTHVSPTRFFTQQVVSLWRMYQSEMFIHFFGLLEDYWKSTASQHVITFTNLAWSLTEIYKFASNLALKGINHLYSIQIQINNLKERELVDVIEPNGSLHYYGYKCTLDDQEHKVTLSLDEITGDPVKLASQCIMWILERFNIDSQSEFWINKIKDKQQELLTRKNHFP
jgi:hypothetical protein